MKFNKMLPVVGALCASATIIPIVVSCQKTEQIKINTIWDGDIHGLKSEEIDVKQNVEYLVSFNFSLWEDGEVPSTIHLKINPWDAGSTQSTIGFKLNGEYFEVESSIGSDGIIEINHEFNKADNLIFSIEFRKTYIPKVSFELY